MELSGQFHAPATLPHGKSPQCPLNTMLSVSLEVNLITNSPVKIYGSGAKGGTWHTCMCSLPTDLFALRISKQTLHSSAAQLSVIIAAAGSFVYSHTSLVMKFHNFLNRL
jgi:hypothetical protein